MLLMLISFIVLTFIIAAGSSILNTMSKQELHQAAWLFLKSASYAAIALGILSVIVFLF